MLNSVQPKFVWLFLASYNAAPDAIPVALRTQADTEEQARNNLAGEWSLTFAAKIRTQCSLHDIGEGFFSLNLYTGEMAKVVCNA